MNPLTNVRNQNKINQRELELGYTGTKNSWHNKYKESAWIFAGGLPYDLTEGDILCIFSQYGEIVNVNLVRDKATGKSKGFCFLCYEDQRSTVLAVDNFNGTKVLNRTLRVDHVESYRKPKETGEEDEITRLLREHGCAPVVPPVPVVPVVQEISDEEETMTEPKRAKKKKAKKEKKKKKKKKKAKSESSSSESDSESEEEAVKYRAVPIKRERNPQALAGPSRAGDASRHPKSQDVGRGKHFRTHSSESPSPPRGRSQKWKKQESPSPVRRRRDDSSSSSSGSRSPPRKKESRPNYSKGRNRHERRSRSRSKERYRNGKAGSRSRSRSLDRYRTSYNDKRRSRSRSRDRKRRDR